MSPHGQHVLCCTQNDYPCIYKQISSQEDMEFLNHNDRLKLKIFTYLCKASPMPIWSKQHKSMPRISKTNHLEEPIIHIGWS